MDKITKVIEIGAPRSPSKHMETTTGTITKLLVTYGGGMGGVNKTYYATKIKKTEGLWCLSLIEGYDIEINPHYLVEKECGKYAKIVYDITDHANYNNRVCNKSISIEYFFLHSNEEVKIIKEYSSRQDNIGKRFFHKENIIE